MNGTSWAAESASSILGPAVALTRIEGGSGPGSGPSQHGGMGRYWLISS
jgi:hypothetical protein